MTKNRAHKRDAKALAAKTDVRHPDAFYLADTRKLRTPDWGMINFAEGPLRLVGEADALDHYRPMEVILKAAMEKNWRIVQLSFIDTRPLPDMLAYLREKPTLTILITTKGAPGNDVITELLSGIHKDLNVAIQYATNSRAWQDLLPGRVIPFSLENGADHEPIPPRITGWHAMVNEIFTGSNPATLGTPGSTSGIDFTIRQAMQLPSDIIIGEIRDTEESPASPEGDAPDERLSGEPTPDTFPASLLIGRPGIGRTARGWARVNAADAKLDALGVPKAAQEFATYPDGLFIVGGMAGAGKTTTALALLRRAMVDKGREACAIVDLSEASFAGESGATVIPVESIQDTAAAIRQAQEGGAKIMLVDGLSSPGATKAAVDAALSGVLVFATMHGTADNAAARLMDMFPKPDGSANDKTLISRAQVPRALRGVTEQVMIRGEGLRGRVMASEVWVKDDQEEAPVMAPVLRIKASLASLVAEGTVLQEAADEVNSGRSFLRS